MLATSYLPLLPSVAGIGLKAAHYRAVLSNQEAYPQPGWVEVHPQNYFGLDGKAGGGPPHRWLTAIAENYPLSFHSVGLSLGSVGGLDWHELEQIALLCERYRAASFSDHLSWSGDADNKYPDLLPIPYTRESLNHFATQIGIVQDRLGRSMLIENPARYLGYANDEMDEAEFIHQLCRSVGCGVLFDINNVVVSCSNLGLDPVAYIDAIDPEIVGEIHLAGHAVEQHDSGALLIDDHGSSVTEQTWSLYKRFIKRAGEKPTLVEWDTNVPQYSVLMDEAERANREMQAALEEVAISQTQAP